MKKALYRVRHREKHLTEEGFAISTLYRKVMREAPYRGRLWEKHLREKSSERSTLQKKALREARRKTMREATYRGRLWEKQHRKLSRLGRVPLYMKKKIYYFYDFWIFGRNRWHMAQTQFSTQDYNWCTTAVAAMWSRGPHYLTFSAAKKSVLFLLKNKLAGSAEHSGSAWNADLYTGRRVQTSCPRHVLVLAANIGTWHLYQGSGFEIQGCQPFEASYTSDTLSTRTCQCIKENTWSQNDLFWIYSCVQNRHKQKSSFLMIWWMQRMIKRWYLHCYFYWQQKNMFRAS